MAGHEVSVAGATTAAAEATLLVDGIPFRRVLTTASKSGNTFLFEHVQIPRDDDFISVLAVSTVAWYRSQYRSKPVRALASGAGTVPAVEVVSRTSKESVGVQGLSGANAAIAVVAEGPRGRFRSYTTADADGRFFTRLKLADFGRYNIHAETRRPATFLTSESRMLWRDDRAPPVVSPPSYVRRLDCEIALDHAAVSVSFSIPVSDMRYAAYTQGVWQFKDLLISVYGETLVGSVPLDAILGNVTPALSVEDDTALFTARNANVYYSDMLPAYFADSFVISVNNGWWQLPPYSAAVSGVVSVRMTGYHIEAAPVIKGSTLRVIGSTTEWSSPFTSLWQRRDYAFQISTRPTAGLYELKAFLNSDPPELFSPAKRDTAALLWQFAFTLLLAIPAFWVLRWFSRLPDAICGKAATVPVVNRAIAVLVLTFGGMIWLLANWGVAFTALQPLGVRVNALLAEHPGGPSVLRAWAPGYVGTAVVLYAGFIVAVGVAAAVRLTTRRNTPRQLTVAVALSLALASALEALDFWTRTWIFTGDAVAGVANALTTLPMVILTIQFALSAVVSLIPGWRISAIWLLPIATAVAILISVPAPFVHGSVFHTAASFATSYDAVAAAWSNCAAIARVSLGLALISWLTRLGPALDRETLYEAGALLFSSYVIAPTRTIIGLPLPFLVSLFAYRNILMRRRGEHGRCLGVVRRMEAHSASDPLSAIRLTIARVERRQLSEQRDRLKARLLMGKLTSEEYEDQRDAYAKLIAAEYPGVSPTSGSIRPARVMRRGPAWPPANAGWICLGIVSLLFLVPFVWLGIPNFQSEAAYSRPYPAMTVVADLFAVVGDVLFPAFTFGLIFRYIRGRSGFLKALRIALVVAACLAIQWIVIIQNPIVLVATIVMTLASYMILGLLVFDYQIVRKARGDMFRWFDVAYAQGWAPFRTRLITAATLVSILGTASASFWFKDLIPEVLKSLSSQTTTSQAAEVKGNSSERR